MTPTAAIILAGGRGKRMGIFCDQRPKPILPFAGKYRVIDMTLRNCVQSQIENASVLVDYQRLLMAEYLEKWNSDNQGTCCVSVLPPRSGSYEGTANAVFQNLEYLQNQNSDTVLILAGDHIYNMDYRELVAYHDLKQADATVAVTRVPLSEAHRFGTTNIAVDGRIEGFVEKSSNPTSSLASMGIYVFNRRLLIERLIEDANNPNSPHDFGYAILPKMIKQDQVFGFQFADYWQDIGTVESYYQANMQLLAEKTPFSLEKNPPVLSLNKGMNVDILNVPGFIVNSLVSPGCLIEGYVENSILSPGVWIGEKARVVNSIVMDNTRVKYGSLVDRCILDENVDIDRFCDVGFAASSNPDPSEITMIGKDVGLGPHTSIGTKSRIMPGLKLADLNHRFIAPGTVVSQPV